MTSVCETDQYYQFYGDFFSFNETRNRHVFLLLLQTNQTRPSKQLKHNNENYGFNKNSGLIKFRVSTIRSDFITVNEGVLFQDVIITGRDPGLFVPASE